jgi:sigma-70-like protein
MASRSEAQTPLGSLPPDQRAAVELVLRRGRAYAELSELLGIPAETVRARARTGVEALAPDLPAPPDAGAIADWLLGQQDEEAAATTRAALAASPGAREWAATVAAPLRDVGGERVPEVPPAADPAPRPTGNPRSSRLGGALVLGALVLAVAGVLAFVLTRGGDDDAPARAAAPGTPTPAATAAASDDILLTGPAGSKAAGAMRLVPAKDGSVRFLLAAQNLRANGRHDFYAVWFTRPGMVPRRLGFAQTRVAKAGVLTTGGPLERDVARFPRWFATYDAVLVTRETRADAKRPGEVVLRGALPHAGA